MSQSYFNVHYGTFYPNAVTYPTLNFQALKLHRSPSITLTGGVARSFPMANGGELIALTIYSQFTQPS